LRTAEFQCDDFLEVMPEMPEQGRLAAGGRPDQDPDWRFRTQVRETRLLLRPEPDALGRSLRECRIVQYRRDGHVLFPFAYSNLF
jgi:hypothetical protein